MKNLTNYLSFHARTRPDAEAIIYADSRISWQALESRVQQTAAGLAEKGIGPDSIVAVLMKNSTAFIELIYAINHVGAIVLPLNYRLSSDEVTYITGHAGADLLIFDTELAALTGEASCPAIELDAKGQMDSTATFGGHGKRVKSQPREGTDLFRLMYTSGTTGRPKGVMHGLDSFYWKCFDHIVALSITAADRLCIVGPLYHVGGSDLPGLGVHLAGGCIVLLREYTPTSTLQTIQDEQVSGIWMAPVMTAGVLECPDSFDTSSLRYCIGGGEKTPEKRIRDFATLFPNARYIDAYGMTETGSGDTLMEAGREIDKIGSVGRTTPNVVIEIRDDDGNTLPQGEEGEICMKGAKVTSGYWKEPEKTAETMHADGFLKSGDVGYLDAEGFLFLTDRKKDIIISGGENVSSSEVELVIYNLPQVEEAAVIARPDERWGEVPVAAVVLKPDTELSLDQLITHCRSKLAGFKCPKDMFLCDALPRNPSGKVLKRVLREQLLEL